MGHPFMLLTGIEFRRRIRHNDEPSIVTTKLRNSHSSVLTSQIIIHHSSIGDCVFCSQRDRLERLREDPIQKLVHSETDIRRERRGLIHGYNPRSEERFLSSSDLRACWLLIIAGARCTHFPSFRVFLYDKNMVF